MTSGTVVFFHAHPDDEAIFTGGTMIRLAAAGWNVVLVVATRGELGAPSPSSWTDTALAARRVAETQAAAALLGVSRLEFFDYRDSGMLGDRANTAPGAFWSSDTDEVATALGQLLVEEEATALVVYDERGIYGHPDHVKVHQVGLGAASKAGLGLVYEVTVDREYLHFVETHLVAEARRADRPPDLLADPLGLVDSPLGVPTVLVSTTVDVRSVLEVKRAAMGAHSSQIPETASAMRLPTEAFAAVYGYEWYMRRGSPGPLEDL